MNPTILSITAGQPTQRRKIVILALLTFAALC